MGISIEKFKPLCTASEWKLVTESLPGAIETFSPAKIATKLAAARRLHDKWRDLALRQKRESGKAESARRSKEKSRLFAVVVRSFEKRRRELERRTLREKARAHKKALGSTGPGGKKTRAISKAGKTAGPPTVRKGLGTPAKIKGHISSRNRRDQAKRDGR